MFAAVGDKGTLLTSEDGVTWAARPLERAYSISRIISGNGKFIATISDTFNIPNENGYISDLRVMATSSDMKKWNIIKTENTAPLNSVIWTNGMFTTVGDGGTILNSTDGSSWSKVDSSTSNNLLNVIRDGQRYIASGDAPER
ncbi:MAG TPA: hypothetical protein VIO64_22755 [Pseudobacteroides sp.]|uniref:hypothetical protein n=1 Tax=Pseudobacteroides sp. TaxID=1968840 RepID=UPI002F92A110